MPRLPALLPLALAATLGCGATILPGEEIEFELDVGESARLEDLDVAVRFVRVSADSRCPIDVTCAWQGDGAVVLRLTRADDESDTTLHTGLEPRSVTSQGITLEVVGLAPAPQSTRPIYPDAYRVQLRAQGS